MYWKYIFYGILILFFIEAFYLGFKNDTAVPICAIFMFVVICVGFVLGYGVHLARLNW